VIPAGVQIYIALEPVDMRLSFEYPLREARLVSTLGGL